MEKIFICGPRVYEFEGVLFEFSQWYGPWPLKKDRSPKKLAGKKFYDLFLKFESMSKDEQKKYRISGGCVMIP